MAPDSVTVYQMELPYNTVYSKRLLEGGELPIADWATKRAWHDHAFTELERAGYVASSAYTVVRKERGARFVYRDGVWSGCDLLGLGLSSFSHLGGVHYQNVAGFEEYVARVEQRRSPIIRAFVTSPDERQVREMILQMKRGHLETAYFAEKFGVAILERFAAEFGELARRGLARLAPDRIELTREGLLRADQLLPLFYAPKYQNARYT
jgi:oxygen-independent coproporphyrinogen-3 oxidase